MACLMVRDNRLLASEAVAAGTFCWADSHPLLVVPVAQNSSTSSATDTLQYRTRTGYCLTACGRNRPGTNNIQTTADYAPEDRGGWAGRGR
eukprot:scaffold440659_cov45-Prasinocladus_malaysianus.AAC.1